MNIIQMKETYQMQKMNKKVVVLRENGFLTQVKPEDKKPTDKE